VEIAEIERIAERSAARQASDWRGADLRDELGAGRAGHHAGEEVGMVCVDRRRRFPVPGRPSDPGTGAPLPMSNFRTAAGDSSRRPDGYAHRRHVRRHDQPRPRPALRRRVPAGGGHHRSREVQGPWPSSRGPSTAGIASARTTRTAYGAYHQSARGDLLPRPRAPTHGARVPVLRHARGAGPDHRPAGGPEGPDRVLRRVGDLARCRSRGRAAAAGRRRAVRRPLPRTG
jgi:hypothetical protein